MPRYCFFPFLINDNHSNQLKVKCTPRFLWSANKDGQTNIAELGSNKVLIVCTKQNFKWVDIKRNKAHLACYTRPNSYVLLSIRLAFNFKTIELNHNSRTLCINAKHSTLSWKDFNGDKLIGAVCSAAVAPHSVFQGGAILSKIKEVKC